MDFSSIESFSENDYESLYEEAIDKAVEVSGIYCYHTSRVMTCSCVSSGGAMDAWYKSAYRSGYISLGTTAKATSYFNSLSSCYWSYDSSYRMYMVLCYHDSGYVTEYSNIGNWSWRGNLGGGGAHLGLGPDSKCR